MELDDLRRQWQQPEPVSQPAITPAELRTLLASQRGGLLDKMRRNTRLEAGLVALAAPILLAVTFNSHQPLSRLYTGFMTLLTLFMGYYYYRVLALLRQLVETTGSVRGHLAQLYGGLRQLLHFYYRLTLATSPALLLLVYGFYVGRELAQPARFRISLLVEIGVGLLVIGAAIQVVAVYGTRWWLQRLYGQHLDRLEGQLRELAEPSEPTAT